MPVVHKRIDRGNGIEEHRTFDLKTVYAHRTSGNITLSSTDWADVDTGIDLTVPAEAGDILEIAIKLLYGNEAGTVRLDVATVVSGSPVNYVGDNGGMTPRGITGLNKIEALTTYQPRGASVFYTVQAGDIEGGNVTLRLRYKKTSGLAVLLWSTADDQFHWGVSNKGQ